MPVKIRHTFIVAAICVLAATGGFAQSTESSTAPSVPAVPASGGSGSSSSTKFGLDLTIGVQTFSNPSYDPANPATGGPTIAYQSLGLKPDLSFGKLGLGLDLTVNYRFTAGAQQNQFEVRKADWVPDGNTSFLELYLPKIRYIRWDHKGAPLYVLLGQVDNGQLGNGYIMGGYTNTQWLPGRKLFGMSFDLDGNLFKFPYVGIETIVSNLTAWDLMGGRFYVRPLAWMSAPILPGLQIGTSLVVDRNPFYFAERDPNSIYNTSTGTATAPSNAQVFIWGLDTRLPILTSPVINLALYGDFVQQKLAQGEMVGAGGRLFGIITYGAQVRFIGKNFIPDYFDSSYDLYRVEKYSIYSGVNYVSPGGPAVSTPAFVGWLGSAGFSLLDDKLAFTVSMDGPFNPSYTDPLTSTFAHPHLRAELQLKQGVIPGFALAATYDKVNIIDLSSLVSAENAVIGARLDYKAGPAIISLLYDLKYDPFNPGGNPWTVTSRLETTISLF